MVKIPQFVRYRVWNTYIGPDVSEYKCICGNKITQQQFECGHVIPRSKNGDENISNLRPICGSCNKSVGNKNLYEISLIYGIDLDKHYRLSPIDDTTDSIVNINQSDIKLVANIDDKSEYQILQQKAKEVGIKANLSKDLLENLITKHDNGEDIPEEYMKKGFSKKKVAAMTGGGTLILGLIFGYIIGYYTHVC